MILAVCAVAAAIFALAAAVFASSRSGGFAEALMHAEHERQLVMDERERVERALLVRAVIARSPAEYAMLDRAAAQSAQRSKDTRMVTRDEYEAMLHDDLASMGINPDKVPSVPDGL